MTTVSNAADDRHTHCSTAAVRADDGRQTMTKITQYTKQNRPGPSVKACKAYSK
ncbi:MAG: hypothetical protein HXL32_06210 [Prevotellaceae bacterium]|nr:hypothetical protein [Prevotellaceae bacterium]